MNAIVKTISSGLLVAALGLGSIGCETKAQTGALVGGAGGAAVGGTIGSFSHSRAGEGALIGGAVGAIGGYIVGNEMDKKDQRERDAAAQRAAPARTYDAPAERPLTQNDIIAWSDQGVKKDVIIDRIIRNGTTFRISVADENEFRDAGVDEDVIRLLKNPSGAR